MSERIPCVASQRDAMLVFQVKSHWLWMGCRYADVAVLVAPEAQLISRLGTVSTSHKLAAT